jgi:mono/diheme cytochrome c family protein
MTKRMWIAGLAALMVPLMARAEVDKKTERTWKAKCASCHGADGKGQPGKTGDLTKSAKSDAERKTAIEAGTKSANGEMEGYKDKLDGPAIDALVAYTKTLK